MDNENSRQLDLCFGQREQQKIDLFCRNIETALTHNISIRQHKTLQDLQGDFLILQQANIHLILNMNENSNSEANNIEDTRTDSTGMLINFLPLEQYLLKPKVVFVGYQAMK